MVLQAAPDTGQVLHHRDAERGQLVLRADPRQQQELRRVDRAAAQDDLARGAGGIDAALAAEADADGAAALEQDLFGERLGDDLPVAALHRRAQIADRGRAAPAVARRRLVIADAVLAGAVEIVVARITELGRAP